VGEPGAGDPDHLRAVAGRYHHRCAVCAHISPPAACPLGEMLRDVVRHTFATACSRVPQLPSSPSGCVPLNRSTALRLRLSMSQIFMSETAVIARRDGILKLMFRIADIKTTQVPSCMKPATSAVGPMPVNLLQSWAAPMLNCVMASQGGGAQGAGIPLHLGRGAPHGRGRVHPGAQCLTTLLVAL
jgi:hypothetical protein